MVNIFSTLFASLYNYLSGLWSQAYGGLVYLIDWFGDQITVLINRLLHFVVTSLPPEAVDVLNSDFLADLYQWFDYAAWVFPIYPALAIVSSTYALIGTIRLVRWVLACIPALNLG